MDKKDEVICNICLEPTKQYILPCKKCEKVEWYVCETCLIKMQMYNNISKKCPLCRSESDMLIELHKIVNEHKFINTNDIIFDLESGEESGEEIYVYNINKKKEVLISILLAIIIYFILKLTCYIQIITTCYYCKFFPIINCFLLFLYNLIHIYKDYFNIQFLRVTGYIILLGMFINGIFIVLIDSQKVLLCS